MATDVEMKTVTCLGPPPHEFEIPKGRGRPPKYCPEHKPDKSSNKSEEKVAEQSTRARPRPGNKPESESKSKNGSEAARPRPRAPRIQPPAEKSELDQPTPGEGKATMSESGKMERVPEPDEGLKRMPPPGRGDKGSRAKAEASEKRAVSAQPDEVIPRGADGRPMARIEFSASELIPTGQYANVTVGPVRVTAYVDLSRNGGENSPYFSKSEKETIIKAANELAEMMEREVIGVQRNLVLESLQSDDG